MTEAWLRGSIPAIPALLQPVAHALVQAREEVRELAAELSDDVMWHKPHGVASAGFHLQHLRGVLDRLFTYARGEGLSEVQLTALRAEGIDPGTGITALELATAFDAQVELALKQLRETPESSLLEARTVGRAQLPSNVIGLLVHAAEHTTRHVGQLLVTVRITAPTRS